MADIHEGIAFFGETENFDFRKGEAAVLFDAEEKTFESLFGVFDVPDGEKSGEFLRAVFEEFAGGVVTGTDVVEIYGISGGTIGMVEDGDDGNLTRQQRLQGRAELEGGMKAEDHDSVETGGDNFVKDEFFVPFLAVVVKVERVASVALSVLKKGSRGGEGGKIGAVGIAGVDSRRFENHGDPAFGADGDFAEELPAFGLPNMLTKPAFM